MRNPRFVTLAVATALSVLACMPARGSAIASFSIFGSADAIVPSPASQFQGNSGVATCSAIDSVSATASCGASATAFDPNGSGGSVTVSAFGHASASPGHIEFEGQEIVSYANGARDKFNGNYYISATASASYDEILSYEGAAPISLVLSFRAPGYFEHYDYAMEEHYSVTVGDNPPWEFFVDSRCCEYPRPGYADFTQTFVVDPAAGSVLIHVQGSMSGYTGIQNVTTIRERASLDLLSANFTGSVGVSDLPEPSSFWLCGLIVLGASARRRR